MKRLSEKTGVSRRSIYYDICKINEWLEEHDIQELEPERGKGIFISAGDKEKILDALDEKDFIADAYILEVSSPGLGRTLKKDKHLAKSLGEKVELKTYKPVDKCKEFEGILKSYDGDSVTITMEPDGKDLVFARTDVALIRLALDF